MLQVHFQFVQIVHPMGTAITYGLANQVLLCVSGDTPAGDPGDVNIRHQVKNAPQPASAAASPLFPQVQPIGNSRTIVDIEGSCYVAPKRTWWVPVSLLLPYSIGIRATIRLGVRGPLETGKVRSSLCDIC
jgi:hypothetical protein